jgi:exodeoxyribonuclease V alpha subunit
MKTDETSAPMQAVAAYAAGLLSEISGESDGILALTVKKLCEALENGGTCVPLSDLGDAPEVERRLLTLPVVGNGGRCPIVVENGLVYFERYHAYETRLAAKLLRLASKEAAAPAYADALEARLLSHKLAIVTGGPGTGKTTLATRLLSILAKNSAKPLSAALAAPTGKAAAHLAEAVAGEVGQSANLIVSHGTIHRLLGPVRGSVFFKRGEGSPLPFDVVVLDEASMADLPLMAKLADAIDPDFTRLFILGDPGQLPSIYCGSILSDIVEAACGSNAIAKCHALLTKNHRSGKEPDLAALVDASREGDVARVIDLLAGGRNLSIEPPPSPSATGDFVARTLAPYMQKLSGAADPQSALFASHEHRLVCMLRQGPCGADAVNAAAVALAQNLGLAHYGERIFHGLPIIVRKNDASQNLFNGDSGIIFRDGGRLAAYFDGETGPRSVPVQSLPPFESAYALTVHGSQGSEYASVTLLLPPSDHPMLTRELFYTGVSRAKTGVKVLATPELVRCALSRREKRASGLAARLARN